MMGTTFVSAMHCQCNRQLTQRTYIITSQHLCTVHMSYFTPFSTLQALAHMILLAR